MLRPLCCAALRMTCTHCPNVHSVSPPAHLCSTSLPSLPRSRCTGYRPILDAFKAFAKVDAAAYTEEAIAASKAGNGSSAAAAGGRNGSGVASHDSSEAAAAPSASNGGGGGCCGAANGHANGSAKQQRVCPSTGRPCDCAAAGELDEQSGTIVSASRHKGEACGPLTHTRPAGARCCPAVLQPSCLPACPRHAAGLGVAFSRFAADWLVPPVTFTRTGSLTDLYSSAESTAVVSSGALQLCGGARRSTRTPPEPHSLCCDGRATLCTTLSTAVEPIFPPELRRRVPAELALPGPRCAWYRPLSLDRLLEIKAAHPDAKLVVGNTGELCGRVCWSATELAQPRCERVTLVGATCTLRRLLPILLTVQTWPVT